MGCSSPSSGDTHGPCSQSNSNRSELCVVSEEAWHQDHDDDNGEGNGDGNEGDGGDGEDVGQSRRYHGVGQ